MADEKQGSEDRPELDLPQVEETLEDGEPELDEWWSWGNFARLFVFPLIIVVVAVALYGTFQVMLQDPTTINEYLTRMRTGPENERWRAAYSLAQAVRRREAEKKLTQNSVNAVINLYRTTDVPRMKQYLALVLAEVPTLESVEALKSGLTSDRPGVKVNTALALGQLRKKAERRTIKQRIRRSAPEVAKLLDDDSDKVRRMAAFVLGSLGNKSVIDDLKTTLNDSSNEVRWNGAIALGQLGSQAGESVLLKVLDRARKDELNQIKPELRQNLLTSTIKALEKIDSKRALDSLRELKKNSENSKVRAASLKAINSLQAS